MIRQEFLLLADGAEAVNGKIYILGGGMERYLARSFPVALKADVALGILVGWADTNNRHALELKFMDEDSNPIIGIEAEFEVGRPAGAKPGQDIRNLLAIKGPFPIPEPGAYKLVIALDGKDQDPPFCFWVDQADMPGPLMVG
jgi:hypothetical protein